MNKRNIFLMYAISLFQGMVFYSSIATLYRQAHGLTLLEMGIIESILSILVFVLEVPWGYICDRIGYKKTLIVCNFLFFLSKIVFWKANGFTMFLIERILLAIEIAGMSGCDTSFLYLSSGKEENPKVFGYFHALGTIGMIFSSIIFSLFIQDNFAKAGLWTVYSYVIAFIFTLFLEDIEKTETSVISFQNSLKEFFDQKRIILYLIASALLLETSHMIYVFYSQLQYQRSGISISYYGLIYVGMLLLGLSGASIGKLVKKVKTATIITLLFCAGMITCFVLTLTVSPYLSVMMIGILAIVEALYMPLNDSILNQQVSDASRVTMLSIYSMVMNMIGVVTNIVFGKFGDMNISYAMGVGCVFCVIGLLLFIIWNKKNVQG